jgi:hypothetical protein
LKSPLEAFSPKSGPPLAAIMNCSLRQDTVSDAWKLSKRTPLAKTLPACNIESDVRSITVTNSAAKVAENFVSKYFNFGVYENVYANQFGCVRGRSFTTI